MPEVKDIREARAVFLSTDIGRGHPMYLDGIITELEKTHQDFPYSATNVFHISSGISLCAWKAVRSLYTTGARGGVATRWYDALRHRRATGGGDSVQKVLGKSVLRWARGIDVPIIVAHPLLAGILAPQKTVVYQHGELVVPPEAIVSGCARILAPTPETASVFTRAGLSPETITITGQCLEPGIVANAMAALDNRLERYESDKPLTIAFFTSGAYPRDHIEAIKTAAPACYREGFRVIVFSGPSKAQFKSLKSHFAKQGIDYAERIESFSRFRLIAAPSRIEENDQVASVFRDIDVFVAPAHERTNWAMGAGLPMAILHPNIGTFAPLNAQLALDKEVACAVLNIRAAETLPTTLQSLRANGDLGKMAIAGFRPGKIDGFARAVDSIVDLAV